MLTKITDDLWIDLARIIEIDFLIDNDISNSEIACIRYLGKEDYVEIFGNKKCLSLKKALEEYFHPQGLPICICEKKKPKTPDFPLTNVEI